MTKALRTTILNIEAARGLHGRDLIPTQSFTVDMRQYDKLLMRAAQ